MEIRKYNSGVHILKKGANIAHTGTSMIVCYPDEEPVIFELGAIVLTEEGLQAVEDYITTQPKPEGADDDI